MREDLVSGNKLDPERWLPLQDRSYWKPKVRKGKARRAGLTQGGVTGARVRERRSGPKVASLVQARQGRQKRKAKAPSNNLHDPRLLIREMPAMHWKVIYTTLARRRSTRPVWKQTVFC